MAKWLDQGSMQWLPARWSARHAALLAGGTTFTAAAWGIYYLYRYQGWFSRAGMRPLRVVGPPLVSAKTLVDEYLQFHFAEHSELLPHPKGPRNALDYITALALLCEKNCQALQDFTGEQEESCALDLGCAVGGTTFELARAFQRVVGIDQAQHCINVAKVLQQQQVMSYTAIEEGEIVVTRLAQVAADIDRSRVLFLQADPTRLPAQRVQFDCVLIANLLEHVADPVAVLHQLPALLKDGGVAVISSTYCWSEVWTPRASWLGGFYDQGTSPVRTFDRLKEVMEPHFALIQQEDLPFLMREQARQYQWSLAHATVWRRKRHSLHPA